MIRHLIGAALTLLSLFSVTRAWACGPDTAFNPAYAKIALPDPNQEVLRIDPLSSNPSTTEFYRKRDTGRFTCKDSNLIEVSTCEVRSLFVSGYCQAYIDYFLKSQDNEWFEIFSGPDLKKTVWIKKKTYLGHTKTFKFADGWTQGFEGMTFSGLGQAKTGAQTEFMIRETPDDSAKAVSTCAPNNESPAKKEAQALRGGLGSLAFAQRRAPALSC